MTGIDRRWARWSARSLPDGGVLILAGGVVAGARLAHPLPVGAAAVAAVIALIAHRPMLLVVAATVLSSSLAARAEAGLRPPALGPWTGWVTVLRDPVRTDTGTRIEMRLAGKHVLATAHGRPSWRLERMQAGDRVELRGALSAVRAPIPGWMRARHVAARLSVREVLGQRPPARVARAANAVRDVLLRGARVMPRPTRSLYAGFVLGDSREQRPEVADDFRASGLSHLLVVSGQNVAFVLALARPGLERLRRRHRVVATLVVLAGFGLITRWEPSVLRATAMAGLAVVARSRGRPLSSLRALALAASGLVLIDPLLVHSLGFALSVGASAGIALAARPVQEVLPGPRWLAEPMSVAVAAHLGTAPFLLGALGGIPVVALLANLLAVPVAGPVMVWGVAAGVPAGLLEGVADGRLSWLLHLPTRALITWVAFVARMAAQLPLGIVDGPVAWSLGALIAVSVLFGRRFGLRTRRLAVGAGLALLAAPLAAAARAPGADATPVGGGATLWRTGSSAIGRRTTVLVVDRNTDADQVLTALRRRAVGSLDVVVATRGGAAMGRELRRVLARTRTGVVVVAGDGRIGGLPGRVVSVGAAPVTIRAGPFVVVVSSEPRASGAATLVADVRRSG